MKHFGRWPRRERRLLVIALSVGVAASVIGPRAGADTGPLRVETLAVPGRVVGVQAEDLDGDGRRDLVVSFTAAARRSERARKVAVFFRTATAPADGHGYAAAPDQIVDAPAGAAWLDAARLPGLDGGPPTGALVFGGLDGLTVARLDPATRRLLPPGPLVAPAAGGGPTRDLDEERGLLLRPAEGELPFFDLVRDWDGDGRAEVLLPRVDGLALFAAGADGRFARAALLSLPPLASYVVRSEEHEPRMRNFAARATFVVPELVSADWDGDGRADLFALVEDLVTVFRAGPGGLQPRPAVRQPLGVRTAEEIERDLAHVHVDVRDLDGDGVADLAVTKVLGGLGQMKTQTGLYFGKKGGGWVAPAGVLTDEGYAAALSFADLDGDGRPDLLRARVSVGLGEMARALVAKKMRVGWEARRNVGRGFSTGSDARRDIDFPVDTSQLADVSGPYPSVAGDFDGDGRADFFAAQGPDTLGVWLGGPKHLLGDSPAAIVKVVPTRFVLVTDLDGDRHAEAVLYYRHRPALAGTVQVLENPGRGWPRAE